MTKSNYVTVVFLVEDPAALGASVLDAAKLPGAEESPLDLADAVVQAEGGVR